MQLWTAFLLGLIGSVHCAGMCGPLALAMPASGHTASGYFAGRAVYNLGRITTYSVLGVVFGLFGRTLLLAGFQRGISIALGIVLLAWPGGRSKTGGLGADCLGGTASQNANVRFAAPARISLPRGARDAQRIASMRPGLCGLRCRNFDHRRFERRFVYGGIWIGNHTHDARAWPLGKIDFADIPIAAHESSAGRGVRPGCDVDFARNVARHPGT